MDNHIIRVNGDIVARCASYDEQISVEIAIENVLKNLGIKFSEDVLWLDSGRYTVIGTFQE